MNNVIQPTCEPCLAGKATKKSFGKGKRPSALLDPIHLDIYIPLNVRNHTKKHYFVAIIDDYSGYGHVHLISHKLEAV